MLMSVRDMDVLRLLCWCQNVRPDDLSSISTETERENLITLGLIKRHQRSDTLLLTNSGRAFLQAALEGDVPNLTLSYHDAAIERRVRLSALMMTAYHAGINVFTITANSLAEPSTLFITAITRSRGHNPWGSARVGAIAHLGSTYYAVHYIYSGIGRMAVNDELAAFHNHTNFGKDTQRAFLFAGASYADIIEELKVRDEKRDTKLIRYSEAYRGLHYPVHLLSCDETGARQLQIMAVPDYRVKLAKLMLRSAYRPPPEDAPAWDATYQNRPFVIGADMNLRRIDTAIASAKKRGCLPISLAALDAQGDAVLLRRYKDTGYAVIYKMTEEFYLAVKKEIAAYQEKCDYLIKSSSQSPAVMERWVLKVQALEEKKRHYEGVLQRELDGLDDEFSVLKLLSQELQVRANGIRNLRFQQRAA